ncbi:MAG: hypothetical protein QM674_15990, partial [Burkholderiaceae bacterium]
ARAAPADGTAQARAASLIAAAERPILYLGGGVIHAGAAALATALAEKASLPTVMTLMALGAMPANHPLSLGMLGQHGAPHTNLALEECDLLIAVGARFDDRATGKVSAFCPRARIIHIDIDPAELDKIKAAHVGIVADVAEALARLLPQVPTSSRTGWLDPDESAGTRHGGRAASQRQDRPDEQLGARPRASATDAVLRTAPVRIRVRCDAGLRCRCPGVRRCRRRSRHEPRPRAALAEALARPGPCLIHASIDVRQKVYPMVPPGAADKEMIGA